MESISVEIILTQPEMDQHKGDLEEYVKEQLALQIAVRIAASETGQQRWIDLHRCRWTQCVYVLDEQEYQALINTATK